MLLHFDAHTDTFHQLDHFLGAIKSAAHWASYLVRDGFVDASSSVQIGIGAIPVLWIGWIQVMNWDTKLLPNKNTMNTVQNVV